MYKKILVPLENSKADRAVLAHIRTLAKLCHSKITFIHIADGFGARYQDALNLADSHEIREDKKYLDRVRDEFESEGFKADYHLGKGDPGREITSFAERGKYELIAMSTHGHKALGDFILGSVSSVVRHRTKIPVLLIRA